MTDAAGLAGRCKEFPPCTTNQWRRGVTLIFCDGGGAATPQTMKCSKHHADAIAVCAYCGRALCADCVSAPTADRMVCSNDCATALARNDQAIQLILQKSLQSLRASAFYCYLCGGLSGAAAIVAWFLLPSTFLILFTSGCALALVASGIWYGRAARKQNMEVPR